MSWAVAIVALAAGVACALAGVFLVLRRMAMMADAISHAILPGLVGGYVLDAQLSRAETGHGEGHSAPSILLGFLGATAAGLLTVALVEALTKSRRMKEDSAIGLVFPVLFAIGVWIISRFYGNVHIDTDAVLYGELAFAPFDTLTVAGRDWGPQSFWVLAALTVLNALFLATFYKELKLSTFDAGLAATLGFMPVLMHYFLMGVVAVTTVGAFSAVGAILSVALIIVPPVTASLLTQRLAVLIGLSVLIGAVAGVGGYAVSAIWDVSPSGMIASVLGVIFGTVLMVAPKQGLVAQAIRRRRQRTQFALEMLVVHLSTHENTPQQDQESTLLHLEQELGWNTEKAAWIAARAEREGLIQNRDGGLTLTSAGHNLARTIAAR